MLYLMMVRAIGQRKGSRTSGSSSLGVVCVCVCMDDDGGGGGMAAAGRTGG